MNIGIIGQSNAAQYSLYTDLTALTGVTTWNGSAFVAATGNGEVALGNALVGRFGTPIRMVNAAVSGSALVVGKGDFLSLNDWWAQDVANGFYDDFKTACTAAFGGLTLDAVVWIQGENETGWNNIFPSVAVTETEYADSLDVLINDQIRADFTNGSSLPQIPVVIARLPNIYEASDRATIENAMVQFAESTSNVWVSPSNDDLPILDEALPENTHYTPSGYITHAQRMAAGILTLFPATGQSISRF